MQDKTDWELVDEPMPRTGSSWHAQDGARMQEQGMQQLLQRMLGPWWRWKLLGAGLVAALTLVVLAMLTGVIALAAAFSAIVAIGIGKLRQWSRRHTGALTP